jgi:hypothetical protein
MATPFVSGVAALLRAHGATAAATQAAILRTAQPVSGVDVLGHGVVNAATAPTFAQTHPHPLVALDFAPRWFRWAQLVLLAAVVVKYSWVLIRRMRRRPPPRRLSPRDCGDGRDQMTSIGQIARADRRLGTDPRDFRCAADHRRCDNVIDLVAACQTEIPGMVTVRRVDERRSRT